MSPRPRSDDVTARQLPRQHNKTSRRVRSSAGVPGSSRVTLPDATGATSQQTPERSARLPPPPSPHAPSWINAVAPALPLPPPPHRRRREGLAGPTRRCGTPARCLLTDEGNRVCHRSCFGSSAPCARIGWCRVFPPNRVLSRTGGKETNLGSGNILSAKAAASGPLLDECRLILFDFKYIQKIDISEYEL